MAIFLRHSWNVQPPRWGSSADVQYAIKVNCEKIYGVDPDSIVLAMPLFWGLPVLDFSGKNNHGTNHGATYKEGSLDFDGNDYVEIGAASDFQLEHVSISVKFNADEWSDADANKVHIISKPNQGYFLRGLSGVPEFYIYTTEWYKADGTSAMNSNQNYTLVGTYDRQYIRIYLDGNEIGNTAHVQALSYDGTQPLRIGRDSSESGRFFNGSVGEVSISNVAYRADQIALFHDLPYGLYQPVLRPLYFFSKVTSLTATLPMITANISGEQAPSLDVTLPMITADILGGGGGFLDATLPMITAEIEGRESQSGDLTVTLPCITADILGGVGGFLDATLPMITAEMRGGALLEATLPCITAGIEGKTGTVGTIDATLPMIVADILGKVETLGDINVTLPSIRAYMSGKTGKVGSIDVTLPMIEAVLTGYQEVTGDLNATLPMITARIVGTPDRFATCTPLRFTEPI